MDEGSERQCQHKVRGRFAFSVPESQNAEHFEILEISRMFHGIFLKFPGNPRKLSGNSHNILEFSDCLLSACACSAKS